MKKRFPAFIALMSAMLLLTSCVPVPENVQNDILALKEAREAEKNFKKEMTFDTISNINAAAPESYTYDNGTIKIDASVFVPDTEQVYKLVMKPCTGFYDNYFEIAPSFIDENISNIPSETDEVKFYSFENELELLSAFECGNIAYYLQSKDYEDYYRPHPYNNNELPLKCITDFSDENLKENITLFDGNIQLKSVADIFDNYSGAIQKYMLPVEITPRKLFVYKGFYNNSEPISDDINFLYLQGGMSYNGVYFDDTEQGIQYPYLNHDKVLQKMNMFCCKCYTDDINFCVEQAFVPVAEEEQYSQLLTLESAVQILSQKAAKNRIFNFDTVELCYVVYYESKEAIDSNDWIKEGVTFYAEPYWRFREESATRDNVTFYINAVTGEELSYDKTSWVI